MLQNKVALITGASRGIGREIALTFAKEGATVIVNYQGSKEKAEEVVAEIMENGGKAECVCCNVADFESCGLMIQDMIQKYGKFDILVNNAGITADNLLISMDEEEFDRVINTNLKGCFNMIKACGRNFIKRKQGKIINISSVSGIMGLAGQVNYSSSKAGVIALTKVVAREFASKNVCCNAIAPGFIITDMTKDLESEQYINSIPLKRLGKPEDIANLAAFLASEASDYITGEVIRADGGLAM